MACKESICKNCFHSYVCEQFNENKDDNNEKCHFFNDHYVPTADVAPKSEVAREIFEEIEDILKIVKFPCINAEGCITPLRASYWAIDPNDYAELKKKHTEGEK